MGALGLKIGRMHTGATCRIVTSSSSFKRHKTTLEWRPGLQKNWEISQSSLWKQDRGGGYLGGVYGQPAMYWGLQKIEVSLLRSAEWRKEPLQAACIMMISKPDSAMKYAKYKSNVCQSQAQCPTRSGCMRHDRRFEVPGLMCTDRFQGVCTIEPTRKKLLCCSLDFKMWIFFCVVTMINRELSPFSPLVWPILDCRLDDANRHVAHFRSNVPGIRLDEWLWFDFWLLYNCDVYWWFQKNLFRTLSYTNIYQNLIIPLLLPSSLEGDPRLGQQTAIISHGTDHWICEPKDSSRLKGLLRTYQSLMGYYVLY